jgi:hypothetical protein
MFRKCLFYAFIILFKTDSKKGHGIQRLVIGIYLLLISLFLLDKIITPTPIEGSIAIVIGYSTREDDKGIMWYKKTVVYYDKDKKYHQSTLDREIYYKPILEIGKVYSIFYINGHDNITINKDDLIDYETPIAFIVLCIIALLFSSSGIIGILVNKDNHILWEFHPYRYIKNGYLE